MHILSPLFKRSLPWFFVAGFLCPPALADFGDVTSYQHNNDHLTLVTDQGEVTITQINAGTLAVDYVPTNVKQLPGFALDPSRSSADTPPALSESREGLWFGTDSLRVHIQQTPLSLAFYRGKELLVQEEAGLFVQDALRGFRFNLDDDEKLLGGGQRVLGMDRRGQRMPLYNKAHYGYETESNQMYFSLPAVVSDKKYALVFDNSASGHLDIGATEADVLQFEAVGGRTAYIVSAGSTYPELLNYYTHATGRQPLPPRWALGNFASRFGYRTQQEVKDTIAQFKASDFPVDALVLDLYWFGKDIKGHMGNLAWDKNAFPEPQKMIKELADQGVKTILITEPFVLTSAKRWDEAVAADVLATNAAGKPKTFNFYFGNTGLIDVFHKPAQAWFWSIYQELMLQGVAGWWGDLGEPEVHPDDSIHRLGPLNAGANEVHNAYGHQWARMVYENQRRRFPDTRPMIMMRAGFAGSQRYGMIPWTGDVSRTWGGLKPQVELSLQMSMLGLAYTHSDLGGFAGGEVFDPEMYVRWLQYGVFQPVYRPHAQEHIAPEPVFHSEDVQNLLRPFVKLRYQMLPYNYSLAFENSLTGMPLMRPLFFEDESKPALIDNSHSYLWGDAFLVTPVTDAGVESVSVELPKGVWYDYFTGERFKGGKNIEQKTELKHLPVLVRAGSFVPMADTIGEHTGTYNPAQLTLHYYHDNATKGGRGVMYEDDGLSPDSIASSNFQTLSFNATNQRSRLQLDLTREGHYTGAPETRELTLVIHHLRKKPRAMSLDGQPIEFHYDDKTQSLTSRVTWTNNTHQIEIKGHR